MKYVFSVLAIILLLVLAVVFVFNRGDDSSTPGDDSSTTLVSYATKNSSVSLTTHGPLVGDEERRAVRVTVTPTERRFEILSGYEEHVINGQTYQNTQAAYENFLSALNLSGFMRTKESSVEDERGVCPSGNRYEYLLRENSEIKNSTWSTSCNSNGTFAGNGSTTRQLFQEQIPEYGTLTEELEI